MAPRTTAHRPARRLGFAAPWALACLAMAAAEPACAGAPLPPVSTAELCLLLRGGETGAEVLSDTAGRPLLDPLDAGAEQLLRDAGADRAFIAALRNGRSAATPAQVQAERLRQDELARQRTEAWEINQARLRETSHAALENTIAARAQEAQQSVARLLRDKLIVYRDQRFQTYDNSRLPEKKRFAFYFATLVDPRCRKFTAELVKFYEKYAPAHPEFELVFVSKDYSSFEMETDVRAFPMPWPMLDYAHLSEEKELLRLGDDALPRLLVVDGARRVLADSFPDGHRIDPQHVLDALLNPPRRDAAE